MENNTIRSNRKLEHIKNTLENDVNITKTGLEDIVLLHQALPKYDINEITTECNFLNKKLKAPLYINAMTGGHKDLYELNKALGEAAGKSGIAVAVGSQKSGIVDKGLAATYAVVRKANPNGIVIGNLSANVSLEEARLAVDMIEADALQLHLNVAQEITMAEGERNFSHITDNIINIKNKLNVPIIVKEVGCGMSKETMLELVDMGIDYIDISGAGGTNFINIEMSRQNKAIDSSIVNWGIPTAFSIIEANIINLESYMVSGGIKNALDCAKCLAMGASMVGFSGEILRQYYNKVDLSEWIEELIYNIRRIMLLTNSRDIQMLRKCNKVIKGELLEWKSIRG